MLAQRASWEVGGRGVRAGRVSDSSLIRTSFAPLHLVKSILKILLKPFCLGVNADLSVVLQFGNDLEGAVGRLQKLELPDASLRDDVVCRTTPAPFHQADGFSM